MIRIEQVGMRFGNRRVLDAVTLALDPGRTHVLLGASGSGKSTLLRILAGVLAPSEGALSIDGRPVTATDQPRLARVLGFMTQDGGLFPHLTARENATLVARLRGRKAEEVRARLDELARAVALDAAVLERYPAQLSGGQRQRVALVRALFLGPNYLLLDEPLGALDPLIRRDLQETLRSVFARFRTTVVLVTHDLGEAAFFGDTITLLRDGRVLQHGSFDDLASAPADPYVTEFLQAQRPAEKLRTLGEG